MKSNQSKRECSRPIVENSRSVECEGHVPSLRERYLERRQALAEEVDRMEETDPKMANSARGILFPAH